MKKIEILCLIDDDEVYQFTATKSIEAVGITKKILVFSDGEQGIEFLKLNLQERNNLPDVIFLDINMPYLDGWGFLEEFAKLKNDLIKPVTIYMVSSSVLAQDQKRAEQISEVSGYIIKPITADKFMEIVHKGLDED